MTVDTYNSLKKGGYNSYISDPVLTRILTLNSTVEPFSDMSVRRAFATCLDKKTIVQSVFGGLEQAADTYYWTGTPYCNVGLKGYDYDVAAANKLLEDDGWVKADGQDYRTKNGKTLGATFYYDSSNVVQTSLAQIAQSQLKAIGFKLDIVGEEATANISRQYNGDFQLCYSVSWGDPYDPHSTLEAIAAPAGSAENFAMNIETVKTLWKPAPLDEKTSAQHWDGYAGSFAEKSLPTADDSLTLRIIKQQNLLPCGGRVLDVGCGTGRFSFALEAAGAEATGTDLSPKMIEKAAELKRRRNSGVELFNDDWSRVDLAARGWKGAFDLVLANMGASDIIVKPFELHVVCRRVQNIIELNQHKLYQDELIEEQSRKLRESNAVMINALSSIIEYRSVETGKHIQRIGVFTRVLLEDVAHCYPEYLLDDRKIAIIFSASALHDIGKIAIPDAILNKPGRLTPDEYEIMYLRSIVEDVVREIDARITIHDFRYVPGATHTNLVFDIVVPYKFGECDDDLKKQISDEVEKRLPQHKCVIKCDNSFV